MSAISVGFAVLNKARIADFTTKIDQIQTKLNTLTSQQGTSTNPNSSQQSAVVIGKLETVLEFLKAALSGEQARLQENQQLAKGQIKQDFGSFAASA